MTGTSVEVRDRFKGIGSPSDVIGPLQKRLCLFSMIAYILFVAITAYPMLFSDFKREGY